MNRLTKRDDGNAYFPQCFEEPCNGGGCELEMCDFINQVCEKLAEYEDTGLTPEQISALQKDYMWNYKSPGRSRGEQLTTEVKVFADCIK